MNPGDTTQSEASMVCPALPLMRPISTIFPAATATSACRPGAPVPSMTRPFRISRSYAMSFVVRPHPDDLHYPFFPENLINETLLDVDSPRAGPFEVTHQFLVWRRISERILSEDRQKRLGPFTQTRSRDLSGIFLRLLG